MNHRHCFPFLVEKDDAFAGMVRRALLDAGVPNGNIHRYRDGESALAALRSTDIVRPSAVLLDLDLPGMSGLSVLEQLRASERLEHLPAFVLSAAADPKNVASAYALGAGGYWLKSWNGSEMLEIVQGILDCLSRPGLIPARCLPDPRSNGSKRILEGSR